MLETIYFTRHGHRSDWIVPVLNNCYPTGLFYDPQLSPHGCNQAKELAQYFVSNTIQFDKIYSSPLFRTVQTANYVAEKLDLEILVENGLGEWEIPEPAPTSKLREFFPRINTLYTSVSNHPKADETIQDVHDRLNKTMQEIISRCEAEGQIKSILLVGHAASVTAGVRAVLEDRLAVINCGTCSLSKFVREGGKWKLRLNGDCSFLSGREENNWAFD
ncbi:phosphoglycerate mutase-like protein [Rhizophagus irregularis]|uniref:Phosphoglycerate mutase family protein n=1 Tax=Rhizophagus irregularis TaxID=588596 RepID=A0A141W386_9GLOM|nr:phosphoglycerate mutase family protein [Rhizophagus irregularis]PKB99357.1 phosphoglycerate mutase-like protein [Rhizophagus irregularis]